MAEGVQQGFERAGVAPTQRCTAQWVRLCSGRQFPISTVVAYFCSGEQPKLHQPEAPSPEESKTALRRTDVVRTWRFIGSIIVAERRVA